MLSATEGLVYLSQSGVEELNPTPAWSATMAGPMAGSATRQFGGDPQRLPVDRRTAIWRDASTLDKPPYEGP